MGLTNVNSDRESRVEKTYAEDREVSQTRVLNLIHVLAFHKLPPSFLILSRPEAWIKKHIESRQFKDMVEVVDLYEVGDHMMDVETFVRTELTILGVEGEDMVKGLVRRAGGHMLYASTVIRHIDDPYGDPRKHLQNLFDDYFHNNPDMAHSTPFSSLYELYRQILRSCPERNSSVMIEVLEEIIVINSDLSFVRLPGLENGDVHRFYTVVDRLAGRDPGSGVKAMRGLHSVVRLGDIWEEPFIHSSFPDFLKEPRLSSEFSISYEKALRRLLSGCLDCMASITPDTRMQEEPHIQVTLNFSWLILWLWVTLLPRPSTSKH